ncbi:MAG: hypothetical protein IJ733_10955 [Lachnospiraceae bacterium]|nr:hypothetical protein [Lachnospiraceae bacterium]
MNSKTTKIVGAFAAILVAAALILGVFFMMNNRGKSTKADEVEILQERDLENAYPETPTEVVKLYWRFNKYMYNKKASDEDLTKLMKQLRKLYDEEMLAEEKNSEEKMLETFKKDKENRGGETIVSAVVEKYDSVKVEKGKDKKRYATVVVAVHTKKSGKSSTFFESFMCRRDENKRWKILGWKSATQQDAIDAGVQ